MAQFSFAQLEAIWIEANGAAFAYLAPTMAAIATAESGGNSNAHATSGEDSRGLWQINVAPGANPQYASDNLFDPITNAKTALKVLQSQGLNAWTTFKDNTYLAHLPGGVAPQITRAEALNVGPADITAYQTKLSGASTSYIIWIAAGAVVLAILGAITGTTDLTPKVPKISAGPVAVGGNGKEKEEPQETEEPEKIEAGAPGNVSQAIHERRAQKRYEAMLG